MDPRPIEGRTAIITGASSGIGRAIAVRLAEAGARVYLAGRDQAALDAVRRRIEAAGGVATAVAADLRADVDALGTLVDRAAAETGGLHIMVNAAGVSHPGAIAAGVASEWREMLETNVLALLVGCREAIRAMRATASEGHLVNVSSIAGRREGPGVYGATKAAVNAIGETLRRELENDPIRVVQILPGAVLTNFGRHFPAAVIEGVMAQMGEPVSHRRGERLDDEAIERAQRRAAQVLASADDVARTVVFAVSQPITLDLFEIVVRPAKDLPDAVLRPNSTPPVERQGSDASV